MSECSHNCETCSENCSSKPNDEATNLPNPKSRIKHVIGVVSGKGGVGKSLVTSTLAVLMSRRGYKCGILDADITGPSIPQAFGIHERAKGTDDGIYPNVTKTGIQVMSINLLLESEEEPVLWRGPVIAGAVEQFWTDVIWDVDYLFVDMPPGTGDVPLTVFQSLPIDGIVVVTSPQDLVSMIVGKAIKMANMMNVPVLGLVENYSYFECPDCLERTQIFGDSKVDQISKKFGVDILAKLPINPDFAKACDSGLIELVETTSLDIACNLIEKKTS